MMKKRIAWMSLLLIAMIKVSAQTSILTLHHEGKVTIYPGSMTQAAVDASVKGDTIYLSDGTFGGFNLPHGLVVLGSGAENTYVSGNITITGNGSEKGSDGYVLNGLYLLNDLVVNDSVTGLRVSQCSMANFTVSEGKALSGAEVALSYIRNMLTMSGHVYVLNVINSKVYQIEGDGIGSGAASFLNCNIYANSSSNPNHNVFQNCIMRDAYRGSIINCAYYQASGSAVNSKYLSRLSNFTKPLDSPTSEEITSLFGTDGTVVGITGGSSPYTLELAAPHVTDHDIQVNEAERKITVTLKLGNEASTTEE